MNENRNARVNDRGVRGGIDTNNRNDVVKDRQDGRTDRTDLRQEGMNHRVDTRNKTASKYADKYWNGNGYHRSGGYYGGWYGSSYYNNLGWDNNRTTAGVPSPAVQCSVHC